MKRLVILTVIAAAAAVSGLNPFRSTDVAQLLPVQALTVDVYDGEVQLDGGVAKGSGKDLDTALQDMKAAAEGHVFLQTAEYVIVSNRALRLLPQVAQWQALRPATAICVAEGDLPEAEKAAAFLQAHDPGITLQQIHGILLRKETAALPVVKQTEGGLRLYGTTDDR